MFTRSPLSGAPAPTTSPTSINNENFTWTAYVSSPSGVAIVSPVVNDPHPGKVIVYEYTPGGAGGEDPAVDYETVGLSRS